MNNKKYFNVLSVFDGISCGQEAIKQLLSGDTELRYYASEIDYKSIKITQHNHPNTIQIWDVRFVTKEMFKHQIDILMGGSPCQNFSIAGKRNGMSTVEEINVTSLKQYLKLKKSGFTFIGESYLFWEFVRLLDELKPRYFLLENVVMKGKTKKWIKIISDALGVEPIRINSSLVSAQNRDRLYWTNIPNVTVPEDKGIVLGDIIPGAITGYGKGGVPDGNGSWKQQRWTKRKDHKSGCLTLNDNRSYITLKNGDYRLLTTTEREILQTLPVGYTNIPGIARTYRNKAIGNSFSDSLNLNPK